MASQQMLIGRFQSSLFKCLNDLSLAPDLNHSIFIYLYTTVSKEHQNYRKFNLNSREFPPIYALKRRPSILFLFFKKSNAST